MAKGKFEKPRTSAAKKATAKSRKHKNHTGTLVAVFAVIFALTVAGFVGIYAYGSKLENSKTIYPNVRVAGVEVGGMTASEAREAVDEAVKASYSSQVLQVQLGDEVLEFDPQQTNVALDADAAIDIALSFGKEEGPFRALANYFNTKTQGCDLELKTALEIDEAYIRSMISQAAIAGRVNAVNSEVALGQDKQSITVTKGTPGRYLDEDALYDAVYQAFQSGHFEPLQWDYVEVPYVEVELEQYFEDMSGEVEDAHYDPETHKIVEGKGGLSFDLEANKKKLADAPYGETLTIAVEELKPEITAEKLQEQMFGTMLDLRSSPYPNNANRTENLRLACAAIDGLILNPGEVFSFNKTVGERTAEKGYKPATVFGGEGESVDGVGGGICQVASTIYWSTLYMNFETVMREPHMYVVTYVPVGMDATIYWDSGLDYKFKNNRENPVMMKANTDGGFVNISFWGVKENDNYVEMTDAETLETYKSEDEEKVDETKPVGYREQIQTAYTGKKVVVHQKVYDGSGKLLKDKEIFSTYKSRPNIYLVGPSEELPNPDDPWTDPDDPWTDPTEPTPDPEDPWGDLEKPELPPDVGFDPDWQGDY